MMERVFAIANSAMYIMLGIDVFTPPPPQTVSFLGISLHMLRDKVPTSFLAGLEVLHGDVDASCVSEALKNIITQIRHSTIVGVICDGCERERAAVSRLGLQVVPCMCHVLNLVLTDILPSSRSVTKPKLMLNFTEQQTQRWRDLNEWNKRVSDFAVCLRQRRQREKLNATPPAPNLTRWTSQYKMFMFLKKRRNQIQMENMDKLSSEDWETLDDVSNVGQPVIHVINVLQKPHGTLGDVTQMMLWCEKQIRAVETLTSLGSFYRDTLLESLCLRCSEALVNPRMIQPIDENEKAIVVKLLGPTIQREKSSVNMFYTFEDDEGSFDHWHGHRRFACNDPVCVLSPAQMHI